MDAPPFFRVSLKVSSEITGLCRFLREPIKNEVISEASNSIKTKESEVFCASKTLNRSVEELITANLQEIVDFVLSYLPHGTVGLALQECVENNLKAIYLKEFQSVKLRKTDVKIISARIRSISDCFTVLQLSQLIYTLANLDRQFSPLISELSGIYIGTFDDASVLDTETLLLAHALVISSVYLNVNVQMGGNCGMGDTLSLKPRSNDAVLGEVCDSMVNFCEYNSTGVTERIIENIDRTLKLLEETNVDENLALLLIRILSIGYRTKKALLTRLLKLIEVDVLDISQLCKLVHCCALAQNNHEIDSSSVFEAALKRMAILFNSEMVIPPDIISQAFHAFYLTGNFDHDTFLILTEYIVKNRLSFNKATTFYRVSFPLAISGRISDVEVGAWIIRELSTSCDLYITLPSNFLFILTSLGSCIKLKKRKTSASRIEIPSIDFENDIYEKAEMFLRRSEGDKGPYFPSDRSAILYLYERALSLSDVCTNDQFVQLLQAFCLNIVKHPTRVKLQLLKESRKRVNEISCGGISQVMQSILLLFGQHSTDAVSVISLYMERILAEITTFNVGEDLSIGSSTMYSQSFLNSSAQLANVLWILDRYNLNNVELAKEVIALISKNNYQIMANSEASHIIDVLHYLAFSINNHDAMDVLAFILHSRLKLNVDTNGIHAHELISILEVFIAAPTCLNRMRHKELFKLVERLASNAQGTSSSIKALSKTLSAVKENDCNY